MPTGFPLRARHGRLTVLGVLFSILMGSGGCAMAGLAAAGPLLGSLAAIGDRRVERTLPADLGTAWNAILDALSRMAVRIEETDRSDDKWTLRGKGEALALHGTLERVTASMSRLSLRVERHGLLADKRTAEELLNQVATSLEVQSAATRPRATLAADALAEQIAALKREIERLGARLEEAREPRRHEPSIPAAPPSPTVEARVVANLSPVGIPTVTVPEGVTAPQALRTSPPAQTFERQAGAGQAILPTPLGPADILAAAHGLVNAGPSGVESGGTTTGESALPAPSSAIALTSPRDGFTVGPDEPPVVVVEGRVDDKTLDSVWLVADGHRIRVSAREGRFRQVLPVFAPALRVWAEMTPNGVAPHRSQAVTIRAAGSRRPSIVLVMQWPAGVDGLDAEVSAFWRARPENPDAAVQTVEFAAVGRPSGGRPSDVFHFPSVKPGVYTVILRYRGVAPVGDVHSTLYLPDLQGLSPRRLRPVSLNETGKAVLARVLIPEGVLWDQDEWFSGRSESVDTITKFLFPDGISWVERRGDPR